MIILVDIFGTEIKKGSRVVFASTRNFVLRSGTVRDIELNKILINSGDAYYNPVRNANEVVVVDDIFYK